MVLRAVFNRFVDFFDTQSVRHSSFHTEDARIKAVKVVSSQLWPWVYEPVSHLLEKSNTRRCDYLNPLLILLSLLLLTFGPFGMSPHTGDARKLKIVLSASFLDMDPPYSYPSSPVGHRTILK